jgi:hypothetical protein
MSAWFLLFAIAGTFAACGSAEKQWYKAGTEYTVPEFTRDRAKCEKNGKLDEECLKQLGWIPLSLDAEKPAPPPRSQSQKGRY